MVKVQLRLKLDGNHVAGGDRDEDDTAGKNIEENDVVAMI